MPDRSGDEADHKDETMVPVDYHQAGQIPDDEVTHCELTDTSRHIY